MTKEERQRKQEILQAKMNEVKLGRTDRDARIAELCEMHKELDDPGPPKVLYVIKSSRLLLPTGIPQLTSKPQDEAFYTYDIRPGDYGEREAMVEEALNWITAGEDGLDKMRVAATTLYNNQSNDPRVFRG